VTTQPALPSEGVATAPVGTLTFLFTDIEGSTRLEQALGTTAYAPLRERHRAVLRAAFGAHGGTEEGTEGDSFFVVFPSARDAVAAAVEAQRALVAEPWPDGREIRVRMGMHAGDATRSGGSLVGLDINRAARIAAAANGGQIVVSETIRNLAGPGLPDDVSLRSLGSHRLKDLGEPQPLLQVVEVTRVLGALELGLDLDGPRPHVLLGARAPDDRPRGQTARRSSLACSMPPGRGLRRWRSRARPGA